MDADEIDEDGHGMEGEEDNHGMEEEGLDVEGGEGVEDHPEVDGKLMGHLAYRFG